MNEIIQELKENIEEMNALIENQLFNVKDAQKYSKRYYNIWRSMEDLEASRDNWKSKYNKLKSKYNKLKEKIKNGK